MKPLPWQVRMTLWVGVVGPLLGSLILMAATYVPLLPARTAPIDLAGLAEAFILFAVPVGYVFGIVPAFLAGAVYSGVLTTMATDLSGTLPRMCLAAICGGAVCGTWFYWVSGPDWRSYATVGALVAALLSLRWSGPEPRPHLPFRLRGESTCN
jgi:hypothetical protein